MHGRYHARAATPVSDDSLSHYDGHDPASFKFNLKFGTGTARRRPRQTSRQRFSAPQSWQSQSWQSGFEGHDNILKAQRMLMMLRLGCKGPSHSHWHSPGYAWRRSRPLWGPNDSCDAVAQFEPR